MGKWKIGALVLVAVVGVQALADELPEAKLDCGGMTFAMEAISDRRFPISVGGLSAKVGRTKESDPEKQVVLDIDWAAVRKAKKGPGLAFHYRYFNRRPRSGLLKTWLWVRGMKRRPDGSLEQVQADWNLRVYETGGKWAPFYLPDAGITTKADVLELQFEFGDSLAEFEVKDVDGVPPTSDPARNPAKYMVELRTIGYSAFDDTFVLSPGDQYPIHCDWRLNPGVKKVDMKDVELKLEMPPGVWVVGEVVRDGEYAIASHWKGWFRPVFFVKTDAACGTDLGEGRLVCRYRGEECAKPIAIRFRVGERPVAKAVPKRFLNGFGVHSAESDQVSDEEVVRNSARLYMDCGARAFEMRGTNIVREMRRMGAKVKHSTATSYFSNGYMARSEPWAAIPESERFVADDPAYKPAVMKGSLCPQAIYKEKSFFRNHLVPTLKRAYAEHDALLSNWEPNVFYGHGCFCRECLAAFAAHLKRDVADVGKDWPACARPGGRFAQEAIRFRALEHAKVVRTYQRVISSFMKPDADGFVPELAWTGISGGRPEDPLSGEIEPDDYMDCLRSVNAWGPYVWIVANKPYLKEKRMTVAGWAAAKMIRERMDRVYGAKCPRLVSFPHAMQGLDWVTQPEWFEMNLDCCFFNRWQEQLVYFWRGYDARWYRAFARATERAGWYEDYVFDGRRVDGTTEIETVPEYAVLCRQVSAYMPSVRDMSPLCTATYELNGARIVAALNFWEDGEAFFTLKCRGLAKGRTYTVLSDRRTYWTKDDGVFQWSAEELERGIFVQVGAARTKVFEICPYAEPLPTAGCDRIGQAAVRQAYETARPTLEKAAVRDREEEAGRTNLLPDGTPMI